MNPNKELEALRVLLVKLLLDENNGALPATFDLRPHENAILTLITQSQHTAVREFAEGLKAEADADYKYNEQTDGYDQTGDFSVNVDAIDSHLSEYLERIQ